jgi:hypothetical protein
MWLPDSAIGSELGVQAPIGFWDPLGFCKDGDVDNFKNRRVTKLKRGRVAVRAAMGFIAPDCFEFPGCLSLSAGLKRSGSCRLLGPGGPLQERRRRGLQAPPQY